MCKTFDLLTPEIIKNEGECFAKLIHFNNYGCHLRNQIQNFVPLPKKLSGYTLYF